MRTGKLVSYGVVILLAGCGTIPSLHPLYTKETVTFDEKLLGIWLIDPNTPETTWEFARLEADAAKHLPAGLRGQAQKCYRTNVTDKGRQGSFVACLVRLQDQLYLDIWPDKFPSGEQDPNSMKLAYNAFLFLPIHVFVRVNSIGDQIKIRPVNGREFKKLLDTEPQPVRYDTVDRGTLLTASTAGLRAFLTKYANDERLFPSDLTLTRKDSSTK